MLPNPNSKSPGGVMTKGSPFEYDISVSAYKRRRARSRRGMSGAFETSVRKCEHPGCEEPGKYRAPKHPDQKPGVTWYCRRHARQYNLRWNFFDNHGDPAATGDEDPEDNDVPWGDSEPRGASVAWDRFGVDDPLDVLGFNSTQNPGPGNRLGNARKLSPVERRALDILDARDHWSMESIRKQYKQLVKDLHPDLNGGDRTEEARLQDVVWAWEQIRKSPGFRD